MDQSPRTTRRTAVSLRDALPWHEMVLTTEMAERTGYETLFVPEIAGREAFGTLSGLARATYKIKLASGVVTMRSRKPDLLAMAAATAYELSYGRFILGLGAGSGGPGTLAKLAKLVEFLRHALAGESADMGDGPPFECWLGPQPAPIWLAALGPKTMRLAGEIADGVILNWCTPERVRQARALVEEGAEAAGRDPADITIAVYVRACVGQEDEHSLPVLKAQTQQYAGLRNYRRQFEEMGFRQEIAAAADGRVPDELVRAVCLLGDAGEAQARLQKFRDAGADLPIVYPVPCLEQTSSIEGTILALAPHTAST